jgi:lambda repressor-like predicted transcriptional regulator
MNKKLGIVLGAVVAVGLIASLVAGAALAQGSTPQSQATPPAQTQPPAGPPGRGPGGASDGMNDIAKLLGMTLDQIWAERVQGKTLADLAKEKGVDTQQLVDALVASQKAMLDQAVADNRFTQAQADKWLEWYKQAAALQLTEPYGPGFGFGGMRGGPGGMRGPGGPGGMRGPGPGDQNGNTPPQAAPTPTQ